MHSTAKAARSSQLAMLRRNCERRSLAVTKEGDGNPGSSPSPLRGSFVAIARFVMARVGSRLSFSRADGRGGLRAAGFLHVEDLDGVIQFADSRMLQDPPVSTGLGKILS